MYTGYITNQDHTEVASDYEAAILVCYKRLKSMYLPKQGFCLYPPEEGGTKKPDTCCASLGVKRLLTLPASERSGVKQKALLEVLDDIRAMVKDAAAYYKIDSPPKEVKDCHAAYRALANGASQKDKDRAAAYVRSRLIDRNGQTYVEVAEHQPSYRFWRMAVSPREETASPPSPLLPPQQPV